ncbi:unnamed protein product, partial [Pylaiella littoralis]
SVGFVVRGLRVIALSTSGLRAKTGFLLSTRGMVMWYCQNLVPVIIAMIAFICTNEKYRHFINDEICLVNSEIIFWSAFVAIQVFLVIGLSVKL